MSTRNPTSYTGALEEVDGQHTQAAITNENISFPTICAACGGTISYKRAYKRHFESKRHRLAVGEPLAFTVPCGLCNRTFTRDADLKRHERENRCPLRPGAPEPPRTVLGKRAFDETTQSPEQKVVPESGAMQGLEQPLPEWFQDDPTYTAAAGTWQVATQEQPTLALSEPSESLSDFMTKHSEEHVATELPTKRPLWLYPDQPPVLPDTLAANVAGGKLFEPSAYGPLYAAEAMTITSTSVVIDYEWAHDLTGYYELADLKSLQDLNGVGATGREVGDFDSRLATILESPAIEAEPYTAGMMRSDTNSKQEPLISSKTRLQHILEDPVVRPLRVLRGRQPLRLRGQKCSLCKQPYEMEGLALRQHLDSHFREFRAMQAVHFCKVCDVGFVHEQDLHHHTNIANSGSCCGLAPNHTGPCKGYLCGFNFKHIAPCNGHHSPRNNSVAWSDHDRFKFGYFLRNWEVAQLQVAAAEASKVQRLQEIARCISTLSISECGSGKQKSEASNARSAVSWRSEPSHMNAEVKGRSQFRYFDGHTLELPLHLQPELEEVPMFTVGTVDHDKYAWPGNHDKGSCIKSPVLLTQASAALSALQPGVSYAAMASRGLE
ncbi:hypothetical protein LTR27_000723 [Elasticomyces elasticus]|nr:hypothetical protein LTR27_000723 [Elasticomyces elasticus]